MEEGSRTVERNIPRTRGWEGGKKNTHTLLCPRQRQTTDSQIVCAEIQVRDGLTPRKPRPPDIK